MLMGRELLQRALYHERQSGHAAPQQQGQAYSHTPAGVQEQHSRQQVPAPHATPFSIHANAYNHAMLCAVTHHCGFYDCVASLQKALEHCLAGIVRP